MSVNNNIGIIGTFDRAMGPGLDPNEYAQQYADQNGISVEEAKVELQSQYGEPNKYGDNVRGNEPIFNPPSANPSAVPKPNGVGAIRLGEGAFKIDDSKTPEENAQAYADLYGCTFEEANIILYSIYGDPQTHEGAFKFDNTKTPEQNAQAYADAYGMDVETANEILISVLGEVKHSIFS